MKFVLKGGENMKTETGNLKEAPAKGVLGVHLQMPEKGLSKLGKDLVGKCKENGMYTAELLTGKSLPKDFLDLK